MENKDFEIVEPSTENLTNDAPIEVTQEDFSFIDTNSIQHETKFETKPTTFLKDSLKRFSKNKSSVVAAIILGTLLLLSIFVPLIDQNDVSVAHPDYTYLEPKLFPSGTGFWDGTKKYSNIPYDSETNSPDPESFVGSAVSNLKVGETAYIDVTNKYGKGGYVQFSCNVARETILVDEETDEEKTELIPTTAYLETATFSGDLNIDDENTVSIVFGNKEIDYYKIGNFDLSILYTDSETKETREVFLYKNISTENDLSFNIGDKLKEVNSTLTSYSDAKLRFSISNEDLKYSKCILIKSVEMNSNSGDSAFRTSFKAPSFTSANEMVMRTKDSDAASYWVCNGYKYIKDVEIQTCSFTYDTYEAKLGNKQKVISQKEMQTYIDKGYCSYNFKKGVSSFERLSDKCPIIEVYESKSQRIPGTTEYQYSLTCLISQYRYLPEFSSMPIFLFGTDSQGRDMLKYVFEGLRTSLLLGICTFAFCFVFGLIWGSISGYFGGTVDLLMERLTDILSGMPWIVVMTLVIIHLGSNFWTFALALCLTGWIGTASLTRTQFYRFRDREYVLASRTLGAGNIRLIFKHILPNALGTIITSSVLMIPSVIFSEATISYLGLGLKNLSSLGVILSNNQSQLLSNPYLLLFPSVIIALTMISFNLFGNGLRDAVNPSLKGEE